MELSTQDFRDIQSLVRNLCGLVLSDHKTYLVRTRLESVVRANGFNRFADYLGRVQQLDAILMRDELVEALTTGETSFNRDGHPFEEFRRRVLPALGESMGRRRQVPLALPVARYWSAGCSTGQEPYSIAMAVHDFVASNPRLELRFEQFPILASDISGKALNRGREGRYATRELERGLSNESRTRHFTQRGSVWVANDYLRKAIDFRKLNLIDRLPFGAPFEIIFCRKACRFSGP
jgi:chemotaxis protein methyltransferase CheR